MGLETMTPTPTFDATANAETVAAFAALDTDVVIHVFCGDWCKDCRALLPDFAAVLEAAEFPDERIHHHVLDEQKQGPGVAEYDVEYIPTIVIERRPEEGEPTELARFVESEPLVPARYLASELADQHSAEV